MPLRGRGNVNKTKLRAEVWEALFFVVMRGESAPTRVAPRHSLVAEVADTQKAIYLTIVCAEERPQCPKSLVHAMGVIRCK